MDWISDKIDLYFNDELIEKNVNKIDIMKKIDNYIEEHRLPKPPYMRFVGLEKHKTMIDYGSYTNFFYAVTPDD